MSDPSEPAKESTVCFPAVDGFNLTGTLFEPYAQSAKGIAVVFNCGGGVVATRYRRFARYLAANGIPVLTYDYRGMGQSRPPRLRGFVAQIEDWAEFDCAGAIRWLRARYPAASLVGFSHSIGALLLGGAPNAKECSRFVFVCAHTGYFRDYRRRYRLPMALLWHRVMPLITRLVGYFPARRLGLGDDIPFGIALQWAKRRTPDLRQSANQDGRARAALMRCSALRGKALVINVDDDAFATEAGTRRLLSYFPGLETRLVRISPSEAGVQLLGHFGFFRAPARAALWPIALKYVLETKSQQIRSDPQESQATSLPP